MLKPFALVLVLGMILASTEARAQYGVRRGYPAAVATNVGQAPAAYASTMYSSNYSGPAVASQPSRVYHYSYYTLSPLPPRTYVGFGTEDFPFHGVPYGHPYDPWTWPMMSSSYGNGLARYYDPPVK